MTRLGRWVFSVGSVGAALGLLDCTDREPRVDVDSVASQSSPLVRASPREIVATSLPITEVSGAFGRTDYLVVWTQGPTTRLQGVRVTPGGHLSSSPMPVSVVAPIFASIHKTAFYGNDFFVAYQASPSEVALDRMTTTGPEGFSRIGVRSSKVVIDLAAHGGGLALAVSTPRSPDAGAGQDELYLWSAAGERVVPLPGASATGYSVRFVGEEPVVAWRVSGESTIQVARFSPTGDLRETRTLGTWGYSFSRLELASSAEGLLLFHEGVNDGVFAWQGAKGESPRIFVNRPPSIDASSFPILLAAEVVPHRGAAVLSWFLGTNSYLSTLRLPDCNLTPPLQADIAGVSTRSQRALVAGPDDEVLLALSVATDGGYGLSVGALSIDNGLGASCTRDLDCLHGHCADGVCCDRSCDGPCETCRGSRAGVCEEVRGGPSPRCSGVRSCSPTGTCVKARGERCVRADDCESGHCSDGYCCDQACDQGCQSCAVSPGTCLLAKRGSAGKSAACAGGLCNGQDPTCPNARPIRCLDRASAEQVQGPAKDCTPYVCNEGVCRTTCDTAYDCATGFVCSSLGECLPTPAAPSASCRMASPARTFWFLWAAVGAFFFARRRRP